MKTLKNKRKQLAIIYFFLFLIIPIILTLFWKNLDLFLKFRELKQEKITLEKKLSLEKKITLKVNKSLKKINNPAGQDEILQKKFLHYKPGEKIIEIVE